VRGSAAEKVPAKITTNPLQSNHPGTLRPHPDRHETLAGRRPSSVAACCEGRMLAKENPALFRELPEIFKVGQPLP
jgi:hypothetical protein